MSGVEIPSPARVKAALAARGVRPRRRFGQNFLFDPRILERIAAAAEVGPGDVVLEVGPGAGTLTAALLARGAHVVAVEVDRVMVDVLGELLAGAERLRVVQADVLAERPRLPAAVRAALAEACAAAGRTRWLHVANLPYQVASTLLVDLLFAEPPPERIAVTIQLEVAERLVAAPGTGAYGPLGALVQLRAAPEVLFRLAAGAFWPAPKVESACVRLVPRAEPLAGELPGDLLREVVHAVFFARRKSLANSLALAFRGRLDRARIEAVLARENLGTALRGESLAPMQMARLARALAPELRAGGAI